MIVWDDGTKKQRIYEMWQDNFHDPVSYADFYFKEVYGKNEVLINQEEDVAKGMLHLNPYLLHVNEQPVRAKYIVGVATDKEYRRQGVMNNRGYISAETRGKVEGAMKKLNYQPNQLARSFHSKKTFYIGLLIPDVTIPFFTEMTGRIETRLHKQGYKLFLCNAKGRS